MSSVHHEEEWLDVAVDATIPSVADQSEIPLRTTPLKTPDQGEATSQSGVLKVGTPHGALPESTASRGDVGPFYQSMRENAEDVLKTKSAIFHVDLGGHHHVVRDAFNSGLSPDHLQEHNCAACHSFMKKFGDLAVIDAQTGNLRPLFWNDDIEDDFFRPSVKAVANLFRGRKVKRLFRVTEKAINAGMAEAGGFAHMSFKFPAKRLHESEPTGFASATLVELGDMLARVLADNEVSTIHIAAYLLLEDKLPYADNHKGAIRWLRTLIEEGQLGKVSDEVKRHNLLYHAAADSFLGCIHQLRSGALSCLLKDIELDLPFSDIKDHWIDMVDPISYMRPTAAPSLGNIAAAEKLFAEMGLTKTDLQRKYLLMKNVPKEVLMWTSPTVSQKINTIFAHLLPKSKSSPPVDCNDDPSISPKSLTFASFINSIIPTAEFIEYHLSWFPSLHFMITGLSGTNPLMQWHTPTNLASGYVYHKPQAAEKHSLKPGWVTVSAIIPAPNLWEGVPATSTLPLSDELVSGVKNDEGEIKAYKHGHHGWRYLVCLDGIEDTSNESCLFPTYLRKELHGVRSTVEAYSKSVGIERVKGEGPMVGGISVEKDGGEMEHLFRVRDERGRVGRYKVTLFQ